MGSDRRCVGRALLVGKAPARAALPLLRVTIINNFEQLSNAGFDGTHPEDQAGDGAETGSRAGQPWSLLPKPLAARAESSSESTRATAPVSTGTGTIWAILSPAASSMGDWVRLTMTMRISPRYPASMTPPVVARPRAAMEERSRTRRPR